MDGTLPNLLPRDDVHQPNDGIVATQSDGPAAGRKGEAFDAVICLEVPAFLAGDGFPKVDTEIRASGHRVAIGGKRDPRYRPIMFSHSANFVAAGQVPEPQEAVVGA